MREILFWEKKTQKTRKIVQISKEKDSACYLCDITVTNIQNYLERLNNGHKIRIIVEYREFLSLESEW